MKIAGLCLLLCGCIGIAMASIRALHRKEAEFAKLSALLDWMIREMSSFETPLPTLFDRAEVKGYYDPTFWSMAREEGLLSAFFARKVAGYLSEDTFSSLKSFCSELGKSGLETQIAFCRACKEEIEAQRKRFLSDLPNRKKICFTLCLCLGGMAVILLW